MRLLRVMDICLRSVRQLATVALHAVERIVAQDSGKNRQQ